MTKLDYTIQLKIVLNLIDIAIESMEKFPPENFNKIHVDQFIRTYQGFKDSLSNPDPKFKNAKTLSILLHDVTTFFQESSGKAVNHFWDQVTKQKLPLIRENRLAKIIKRGKIKSQEEYDLIVDLLVPYQQAHIINDADVNIINNMLSIFEKHS